MNTLGYPARIWFDDEDQVFQVEFPDVKGANSYGDSIEEARKNGHEALSGVLGSMFDRGLEIPKPMTRGAAKELDKRLDKRRVAEGKELTVTIYPAPDVAVPILLRWAREDAGLTQAQMAERLKVSQQAYQKLERTGGNPSVKGIAKAARALGRELQVAL